MTSYSAKERFTLAEAYWFFFEVILGQYSCWSRGLTGYCGIGTAEDVRSTNENSGNTLRHPVPIFCKQQNRKNLYVIGTIPSDTGMRETLDEVNSTELRPAFTDLFKSVQRGKCLESLQYIDNKYLVALDGTGYFSSKKIHCEHCLTKTSKKTGDVTYQHQMVGSVMLHPDNKAVLPLCPEPIIKQDGQKKNDCERNTVNRWLEKFRKEYPTGE